jgi:hypothetical protein
MGGYTSFMGVALFDSTETKELAWWDPDVLADANIVPATGLATDYLNVFNEAVMLFGLLPDMPEMIDELLVWEPLTYEQHFMRSGFQAKALAIAAYQNASPSVKVPFDDLSCDIGTMVARAIVTAHDMILASEPLDDFVSETSYALQSAIMLLDGMVHGGQTGGAQDDIDAMFE